MSMQVALAAAEPEGRWLLQRRDTIVGIVPPGSRGLFVGLLDPRQNQAQALRRKRCESDDLTLAFLEDQRGGSIWSRRRRETWPLAGSLRHPVEEESGP